MSTDQRRDVTIRIVGDAASFIDQLKRSDKAAADFEKQLTRAGTALRFDENLKAAGEQLSKIGPRARQAGAFFGEAFAEMDGAVDALRAGTGATGAELDALEGSLRRVAGGGMAVTAPLSQVGQTMADVATRTGATGDQLETLTARMLQLEQVGNQGSVETLTRVFGDWGIAVEDSEAALDQLFRVSQTTGPSVERLGQLIVQYGAPLREFGFGFEDAALLMGKFEQEGVNTQLAMGGLRRALGAFAREGRDPIEALDQLIDAIAGAGSAAEANSLAFEAFGARAGADMARAIQEGRLDLEALREEVAANGDTIAAAAEDTLDWGDKLGQLRTDVQEVLGPFGELGMGIAGLAAGAGPAITGVGKLVAAFKGLTDTSAGLDVVGRRLGRIGQLVASGAVLAVGIGILTKRFDDAATAAQRFVEVGLAGTSNAGLIAQIEAANAGLAEQNRLAGDGISLLNTWYHDAGAQEAANRAEQYGASLEALVHQARLAVESGTELDDQTRRFVDALDRGATTTQALAAATSDYVGYLPRASAATSDVTAATSELGKGIRALGDDFELSGGAAGRVTALLGDVAKSGSGTGKAIADLGVSVRITRGEVETLSGGLDRLLGVNITAEQATLRYEESIDRLAATVRDNTRTLDDDTDSGRENRRAIIEGVEAITAEIEARREQGESTAALRPLMQQHIEDLVATATEAGLSEEAVRGYITELGLTPESMDTLLRVTGMGEALGNLNTFRRELSGLGTDLESIAANLGIRIQGVTGMGGVTQARGGVLDFYAQGGMREEHVAQIAPAGAWRVWAEPETGGEAYIPLAESKRARSTSILQRVAERFGLTVLPFVDGAINATPIFTQPELVRMPVGYAAALAHGLAQVGEPYGWGRHGPDAHDCSGLWSELTNVARGRNPYSRLFNTASMIDAGGAAGWVPGGFGPMQIGVRKGNPGHMSGSINGVNIEATPPRVRSGPGARGPGHPLYTHRFSLRLADGSLVDFEGGDPPFDLLDPRGRNYQPQAAAALAGLTGLATGGVVRQPGAFVVGEHGPEFAVLGAGDAVTPTSQPLPVVITDLQAALAAGNADLALAIANAIAGATVSTAETLGLGPVSAGVAGMPDSGVVGALAGAALGQGLGSDGIEAVIASVTALTAAWDEAARAADETARRDELWAERGVAERIRDEAAAALAAAASDEERTAAAEDLADAEAAVGDAIRAIQDFDVEAARRAEAEAIAAVNAALAEELRLAQEREQLLAEIAANQRGWVFDHADHAQQLAMLAEQLYAVQAWTDAWVAAASQIEQVHARIVAEHQAAADAATRTFEAEQAALVRLEQEREQLRGQIREAERRHHQQLVELAERRDAQLLAAEQQRDAKILAARQQFVQAERQALQQRRDQLLGAFGDLWSARAGSVDAPLGSEDILAFLGPWPAEGGSAAAGSQPDLFELARANLGAANVDLADFTAELDRVRALGLSEDAVQLLGLDASPEALERLRAFTSRTAAEIADFNALVVERQRLAGRQVAREQTDLVGDVGRQLLAAQDQLDEALSTAHAEYLEQVGIVQADYRAAVEELTFAFDAQMVGFRDQLEANAEAITTQLAAVDQAAAAATAAMNALAAATIAAAAAAALLAATPAPNLASGPASGPAQNQHGGPSSSAPTAPNSSGGSTHWHGASYYHTHTNAGARHSHFGLPPSSQTRPTGMHAGGIVHATPGGVLAQIGEGGRDEAVTPLDRGVLPVEVRSVAAGAQPPRVVEVNIHNASVARLDERELARQLARAERLAGAATGG